MDFVGKTYQKQGVSLKAHVAVTSQRIHSPLCMYVHTYAPARPTLVARGRCKRLSTENGHLDTIYRVRRGGRDASMYHTMENITVPVDRCINRLARPSPPGSRCHRDTVPYIQPHVCTPTASPLPHPPSSPA